MPTPTPQAGPDTPAFFPRGPATGDHFCPRGASAELTAELLSVGRHGWIDAPRLTGRTSLVSEAVERLRAQYPNTTWLRVPLSLLAAHDARSTALIAIEGARKAALRLSPHTATAWGASPINATLQHLLATPGHRLASPDVATPLRDTLLALDRLACDYGARLAICVDDFQQLDGCPQPAPLRNALLDACAKSLASSWVFTAATRAPLRTLFGRPLPPIPVTRIPLEPIGWDALDPFLGKRSRARWGHTLPEPSSRAILEATDGHPYYLALLCQKAWARPHPPTPEGIGHLWDQVVTEQHAALEESVRALRRIERAALLALAVAPTSRPRGQRFLALSGLAGSSATKAVRALLTRDLVTTGNGGARERHPRPPLRLSDPALARRLRMDLPADIG